MTLSDLDALLVLLRKHGVQHATVDGVTVMFAPEVRPVVGARKEEPPPPQTQACGHDIGGQTSGVCWQCIEDGNAPPESGHA